MALPMRLWNITPYNLGSETDSYFTAYNTGTWDFFWALTKINSQWIRLREFCYVWEFSAQRCICRGTTGGLFAWVLTSFLGKDKNSKHCMFCRVNILLVISGRRTPNHRKETLALPAGASPHSLHGEIFLHHGVIPQSYRPVPHPWVKYEYFKLESSCKQNVYIAVVPMASHLPIRQVVNQGRENHSASLEMLHSAFQGLCHGAPWSKGGHREALLYPEDWWSDHHCFHFSWQWWSRPGRGLLYPQSPGDSGKEQ